MFMLALALYKEGDLKRAYRYLQIFADDIDSFNTSYRSTLLAEVLPIINKDYQKQKKDQEFDLMIAVLIMVVLSLALIIICLYLRNQKTQLAMTREELAANNRYLRELGENIGYQKTEIKHLTNELKESDQIKDKFVGHFLQLCSDYAQKLGEYQKQIQEKIKDGKIDALRKLTSSQYLIAETKDFYHKFDEAFLYLYPDFIKEFNSLLKDDQQLVLKKGELLNTELRIFALIRVGIKDSSQIAGFLGYTPVTIYSYRTKVKSRAKDKDNFDRDIMRINSSFSDKEEKHGEE